MKNILIAILLFIPACKTVDPDPTGDDNAFAVWIPNATVEGVEVSEDGYVYATGQSRSPIGQGDVYAEDYPGYPSVYAMKFARDGTKLRATYLAGGAGQGIASYKDAVVVGGATSDPNFPTKNAFQDALGSTNSNCFLTSLDFGLKKIAFSTFIGGGKQHAPDSPDGDSIKDVKVDGDGNIYYVASGQNNDAPVTLCIIGLDPPLVGYRVYERDHAWGYGGSSKWSNIFLGGFKPSGEVIEIVNIGGGGPDTTDGAFAVSPDGDVFYGGRTKSPGFAITQGRGIYQQGQTYFDGVAGRLKRGMGDLSWGIFIGGHAQNSISAAAVGEKYAIVGRSRAEDYPILHPAQGRNSGDYDAVISVFSLDGRLEWSTYLGTRDFDAAWDTEWDEDGRLWVCGESRGRSFLARFSPEGVVEYFGEKGGTCANSMSIREDDLILGIADGSNAKILKEKI